MTFPTSQGHASSTHHHTCRMPAFQPYCTEDTRPQKHQNPSNRIPYRPLCSSLPKTPPPFPRPHLELASNQASRSEGRLDGHGISFTWDLERNAQLVLRLRVPMQEVAPGTLPQLKPHTTGTSSIHWQHLMTAALDRTTLPVLLLFGHEVRKAMPPSIRFATLSLIPFCGHSFSVQRIETVPGFQSHF
jgi:hypothetical protein